MSKNLMSVSTWWVIAGADQPKRRKEGKRNDGKETAYLFMFDVKNEKNIIRESAIYPYIVQKPCGRQLTQVCGSECHFSFSFVNQNILRMA